MPPRPDPATSPPSPHHAPASDSGTALAPASPPRPDPATSTRRIAAAFPSVPFPPRRRPSASGPFLVVGVGLLIAVWWLVSWRAGPLVLASPPATLRALRAILADGTFLDHFLVTFYRIVAILLFAGLGGVVLAVLAGIDRRIEQVLEPFRWVCMTVPPVILVVIVMFWMGIETGMIVVFGVLILWPIMYVNLLTGREAYSEDLREVARVFRVPPLARLRHFWMPALAPSFFGGAVQIVCNAIRVAILAEVFGAERGMGAAVATTARQLDTPRMTAWILVVVLLAVVAEFALLRPAQKYAYRWKVR